MHRLPNFLLSFLVTIAPLLVGCGGERSVPGPTTPPPPPILDFRPVSGDWAGWAVEPSGVRFWVRAHLESQAHAGAAVGTVEYGVGEPADAPDCSGTWRASKVEPPIYELQEQITAGGGCPNGTVRLELASGILAYDFAPASGGAFAEGTLTRGTDPGTPP